MVIQHYGVLGMHWGQRRSELEGYSKNPKYSELRDTLSKGSIVYRVSTSKREVDSGRTFVFKDRTDAENFGKKLKQLDPGSKAFLLSLKVKEDMIGPSEKERVDLFLDQYKNERIKEFVDNLKPQLKVAGLDPTDLDGNETLTSYRAYTVAMMKNHSGFGNFTAVRDVVSGFSMRRDDYMRGNTKLSANDKDPLKSLDSAYLIFSRSKYLQTISAEKIKKEKPEKKMKHGQFEYNDLYPSGAFFNRRPD